MKSLIILSFILLLNISKNEEDISFQIPIKYTKDYQPLINICMGTPVQCLTFKILTYLNYTYVLDKNNYGHGFNYSASNSFFKEKDAEIEEYSDEYMKLKGYKCIDDFYIEDEDAKLNLFGFYLVTEGTHSFDYDGVIGLGQSSNSFVHYLSIFFNVGIRFIIQTFHDDKNGFLTLGKLKNEIQFDKEVYFFNRDDNYEVKLDKIIFYNEENLDKTTIYKYHQSIMFSPGHNKILCPENFFDYLKENIFTDFIYDEYDCEIVKRENEFSRIVCNKNIIDEYLGEIIFIIGKWNFRFNLNELFEKYSSTTVVFNIVNSPVDDRWIFGYPFFKQHDVIFDGVLNKLIIK